MVKCDTARVDTQRRWTLGESGSSGPLTAGFGCRPCSASSAHCLNACAVGSWLPLRVRSLARARITPSVTSLAHWLTPIQLLQWPLAASQGATHSLAPFPQRPFSLPLSHCFPITSPRRPRSLKTVKHAGPVAQQRPSRERMRPKGKHSSPGKAAAGGAATVQQTLVEQTLLLEKSLTRTTHVRYW